MARGDQRYSGQAQSGEAEDAAIDEEMPEPGAEHRIEVDAIDDIGVKRIHSPVGRDALDPVQTSFRAERSRVGIVPQRRKSLRSQIELLDRGRRFAREDFEVACGQIRERLRRVMPALAPYPLEIG